MAETVEQYIAKLLSNVKGKDVLQVLRDTPRMLAETIHAHTADSLRKPPAPGKWSVSEILAHLSETELAAAWRYRQMLEHNGSAIIPYDQDLWAKWVDYSTCDPKE